VSNDDQEYPHPAGRLDRQVISAVKLPERITAAVDAWAESRHTSRADAICQLIELGLSAAPHRAKLGAHQLDSLAVEDDAVRQIGELLDPSLAPAERERRIRRLIEGPPEFSSERIDLPKHGK
jgi:hypothetical protein